MISLLKNCLTALSIGLLVNTAAQAEIYSSKNADGNTVFTDQRPNQASQPTRTGSTVNYYQPVAAKPANNKSSNNPSELATLSVEDDENKERSEPQLTEADCQRDYRLSCDQVNNWMQYAIENCVNDQRCKDPDFLERKYRPRSREEMIAIANKAAIRNNRNEKEIALFLTKKYTDYCDNQAALACRNKANSEQCAANILHYCNDSRSLQDVFNKYDNLSANEKHRIISKAKAMAVAGDGNQVNYDKMISSLIEILISQAVMGI
ncbi:MAG: DUF4124 domain-containing protein [Spongiibacteraceae bacterium]